MESATITMKYSEFLEKESRAKAEIEDLRDRVKKLSETSNASRVKVLNNLAECFDAQLTLLSEREIALKVFIFLEGEGIIKLDKDRLPKRI